MTDRAAVAMALAAAAGALVAQPFPLTVSVLIGAVALASRRPALLVVAVALASSGLGARAWDGLRPPVTGQWSGPVTLITDPEPIPGGARADVRMMGKRAEAWFRGRSAAPVYDRLSGERLVLSGHVGAVPAAVRDRLARRHIAARVSVTQVSGWEPGGVVARFTNGVRRVLRAGARSLGPEKQSLFEGFVFGDDRHQPPEVGDDFRGSGLSHLLVVSGQNVAFVLAIIGPFIRRFELRGRLVAGVIVLLLFGVLTRWEPSVQRATAMAAISMLATTLGRPVSTLRLLALAVTAVLLIDPMLVMSVGFQLSVGACAGIAVLANWFTELIPGPRPVASVLAVTLAAQAGVAPILVPVFGGLPVAAIPANLVAVPVAAPLMMWGLVAGTVAGVVGGPLSTLLHLPTGLMIAWVAGVARVFASLPLGDLGMAQAVLLGAVAASCVIWRARPVRGIALCAAAAVLGATTMAQLAPGDVDGRPVGGDVRLWRRGGATVVVVNSTRGVETRLLPALRSAGVRRIDVLVIRRPGAGMARALNPMLRRIPVRLILAPPGHQLAAAVVPAAGASVRAGGLSVTIDTVHPRMATTVTSRRSGPGNVAGRAPPVG